jgi:hypothetical protein
MGREVNMRGAALHTPCSNGGCKGKRRRRYTLSEHATSRAEAGQQEPEEGRRLHGQNSQLQLREKKEVIVIGTSEKGRTEVTQEPGKKEVTGTW